MKANKYKDLLQENWVKYLTVVNSLAIIIFFAVSAGKSSQAPENNSQKNNARENSIANYISASPVHANELTKNAIFRGKSDAPVTMVLFNSFTCGYCSQTRFLLNELERKYEGKLKIAYRHYNRNETDRNAANAVACAGDEGKLWEMYDIIFSKGVSGNYQEYGNTLGIRSKEFINCIKTGKYLNLSDSETNEARGMGISGTPAFLINQQLIKGLLPAKYFMEIIDGNI